MWFLGASDGILLVIVEANETTDSHECIIDPLPFSCRFQNSENVPPNDITDTSKDDQDTGDDIDDRIDYVIAKTVFGNDIDTGITER